MNDKLIKTILDADILQLAGLDDASPEVKEHALADAKNHILHAVISRVNSQLSPELQQKFEQLFGTKDETITEEDVIFLEERVPDLDALVFEETLAFKQGVIDAAAEMKKKFADESEKINGILNGLKE